VTVFAQAPKLAPFRGAICRRLAGVLGVAADRINIKATTTEGLGMIGAGDGIAAMCVALLREVA